MKFFKLALISAVVFFGILCFLFALFPSTLRLSRGKVINAPASKVRSLVGDLKKWKDWNFFIRERLTDVTISSPSDTAGAVLSSNEIRIRRLPDSGNVINTYWMPKKGNGFPAAFLVSDTAGTLVVEWHFTFHSNWYPWEKLRSMFYERELGPLMDSSLQRLKMLSESPE